jgi:hypothetical protein|nr:MAG TPA: hypothetical protein [Caudoviricetes sp.]
MDLVYTKKNFKVFYSKEHKNYIVYNMKKSFQEGHTHLQKYEQTQYAIDCVLKNKIPKKTNKYFLVSLLRLTKDKKYAERLQRIIDGEEKPQHYRNVPKNFRK